ncbi:hypothetical protein C8F01DRAFT_1368321 [Mycena amicta]|nr:hypothetical protein C8F01DRAFT_1368321 [Mycena amicta]
MLDSSSSGDTLGRPVSWRNSNSLDLASYHERNTGAGSSSSASMAHWPQHRHDDYTLPLSLPYNPLYNPHTLGIGIGVAYVDTDTDTERVMESKRKELEAGDPYSNDDNDDGDRDAQDDGDGDNAARKHPCPHLRIHLNTHTGAMPFVCPLPGCGRAFNVNSNMRRHFRNHAGAVDAQEMQGLLSDAGSSRRGRKPAAKKPKKNKKTRNPPPPASLSPPLSVSAPPSRPPSTSSSIQRPACASSLHAMRSATHSPFLHAYPASLSAPERPTSSMSTSSLPSSSQGRLVPPSRSTSSSSLRTPDPGRVDWTNGLGLSTSTSNSNGLGMGSLKYPSVVFSRNENGSGAWYPSNIQLPCQAQAHNSDSDSGWGWDAQTGAGAALSMSLSSSGSVGGAMRYARAEHPHSHQPHHQQQPQHQHQEPGRPRVAEAYYRLPPISSFTLDSAADSASTRYDHPLHADVDVDVDADGEDDTSTSDDGHASFRRDAWGSRPGAGSGSGYPYSLQTHAYAYTSGPVTSAVRGTGGGGGGV